MRGAGYFSLDDVYYGLYESNGNFSALENPDKSNSSLPLLLIDGGKADEKNLALCGITKDKLTEFLNEQDVKLKQVLVLTCDAEGRAYFQKRGEKYKILKMEVNGQW